MKRWQDKTDEEVAADIKKMVDVGKLTVWNPWDHIKTLEEAKDYVEAIYEEWDKESQAANDCIVEILESYMEFIDIMELTIKKHCDSKNTKELAQALIARRRTEWESVLETAKKMQKPQKSAEKSA